MRLCLACGAGFESAGWTCPACGRAPGVEDGIPVFAPELSGGDGSDADYLYDDLTAAEARHFWFAARRRLILRAIARFPRAERLLEIGCGTGYVLAGVREQFPRLSLAGSDARAAGLSRAARRLPGTLLFQMDARRIPFRGEFDVIGAFDVLEHIEEDEAVLGRMSDALRPGGGIVLTVPQHPWLWSEVDDWSHHKRRYTRRGLLDKLRRAGFEPLWATSFSALLLLPLALRRLGSGRGKREFDPAAELRIGALANGLGGVASRIEGALIGAGVRFPAGSSLLIAAARADAGRG